MRRWSGLTSRCWAASEESESRGPHRARPPRARRSGNHSHTSLSAGAWLPSLRWTLRSVPDPDHSTHTASPSSPAPTCAQPPPAHPTPPQLHSTPPTRPSPTLLAPTPSPPFLPPPAHRKVAGVGQHVWAGGQAAGSAKSVDSAARALVNRSLHCDLQPRWPPPLLGNPRLLPPLLALCPAPSSLLPSSPPPSYRPTWAFRRRPHLVQGRPHYPIVAPLSLEQCTGADMALAHTPAFVRLKHG